jgi:hypothetical protein
MMTEMIIQGGELNNISCASSLIRDYIARNSPTIGSRNYMSSLLPALKSCNLSAQYPFNRKESVCEFL